jgi:hypothetical protein
MDKGQKPAILSVIRHRQNPLEDTKDPVKDLCDHLCVIKLSVGKFGSNKTPEVSRET